MSNFPEFSKISLINREEIERVTSRFEPYSDFNFTSLFMWDVDNSAEFSFLNDNLIIRIPDYLTGEPTFSVIGDTLIDTTLQQTMATFGSLKFVPKIVIESVKDTDLFKIKEDRDQFDYFYDLQDLVKISGKKYKNIRNKMNQFNHAHPDHSFERIDDISDVEHKVIMEIFDEWAREGQLSADDIMAEKNAVMRFLSEMPHENLAGVLMIVDGKPAGFSFNEVIAKGEYAVCHLQKSIHSYKNMDTALTHYVSQVLLDRGCKWVNWEQDLGIDGLRQLKETYKPAGFLKKYTIELT